MQLKKQQLDMEQWTGSKLGKEYIKAVYLLFNFYVEYIVWIAGLDESQPGIKIARRNVNSFRYADDTTLMTESEKELKSLLMNVKEENEKAGLKLNIQKTKIMASGPITSWQIDRKKIGKLADFSFLSSKITPTMKLKDVCSLEEKLWQT